MYYPCSNNKGVLISFTAKLLCAFVFGIGKHIFEPVHGKTNNLGSDRVCTGLYSHRRWLETGNFGFRKWRNCTIHIAKTKMLIRFAVTAKLICTIVFAYADCWFSHAVAHFFSHKSLNQLHIHQLNTWFPLI